ncbi:DUF1269 domain-containing protein [Paucibacter sediminis]|uniref:DUF1269 domain-containing protein n=1 Tax=Paucibacter sediminis TaxID=3019553 RepID=A0AA95N8R6_9BURK|nr:DUF1269 domain-containing protein [Paucibacter sp. S2-9]WIT10680.1 DUF1269 domain-containing protein [Paucibacter sp. S2-9]
MRKRIYWLLPNLESATRTMNELLLARIAEQHIHFVASEGVDMTGLHAANVLQTSDLVQAAQTGLLLGAGLGAAAGVAVAYNLGAHTPAGVVIAMAGLGAVLGTWSSSMIGSSTPSRRLTRFQPALNQGQYLLMVDVPRTRVTEIEELLARTRPEAHFEGLEPNVPAFP